MIPRLLRHLAWEGPRHTGRYGFGGRWARQAFVVRLDPLVPAGRALVVDDQTWNRLRGLAETAAQGLWVDSFGPGMFGMPVIVTDLTKRAEQ